MFCMNCGYEFEGQFCPNCGTKIGNGMEKESQQPKELQILRNARNCLTKLEQDNVKLELLITQKVYINSLVKNKRKEEEQKNIELEKLGEEIEGGISKGKAALAAYTLGASLLFTGIHKNKEKDKKYIAEKEKITSRINQLKYEIEELEKDVPNYEEQAISVYNHAKEILASNEWREVKTMINPSYLDVDSITSLIEYLTYGRASTWKEACNLLEDERYKKTMININAAQLSLQQQIVEAQNELINLSMESIDLQKMNIGLQMESIEIQKEQLQTAYQTNRFLNKQLEEMQKIRKNTETTAKSAKMTAFLNTLESITVDTISILVSE